MAIRASGGDLHLGARALLVEAGEDAILVPDVGLLLEGTYGRRGDDLLIRDSAGDGDTSTASNQILETDNLNFGENLLAIEAPDGAELLFGNAGSSNLLDGAPLEDNEDVLTFADIFAVDGGAPEPSHTQEVPRDR